MKRAMLVALILAAALSTRGAETRIVAPFETEGRGETTHAVDRAVRAGLRKKGLRPALPCSDAVFVRRVYVDVCGTLPEPDAVVDFLADRRPDKRARLIDALLESDEHVDTTALWFSDLLRIKSEFPINLWPNAVQAYYRFVHDAVRENRPLDEFARELLTASGSNFRRPAVNFYRAVPSREPAAIAQAVALTFLGSRIETWPAERRDGFATFFTRIAWKGTREWKEEIVFPDPEVSGPLTATLPDGRTARIAPDEDPRAVFADWLTASGDTSFAASMANRVWARYLGRGIVHEPDDFRPGNPPSNPELLRVLTEELVTSGYDLRRLTRLVLTSATYQQSAIPRASNPETDPLFGRYLPRPLGAEVLFDAICRITGTAEGYSSPIPEPFTYVPEDERSIRLEDGSITSPFLELFGRPTRDTGLWSERSRTPTDGQRLYLLNSTDLRTRIERGPRLREVLGRARGRPGAGVRQLWLLILSRPPTEEEIAAVRDYAKTPGIRPDQVAVDLAWALINSKEFLFHH